MLFRSAVSTSGASFPLIQLGTGNVANTSGYTTLSAAFTSNASGVSTSTAGFIIRNSAGGTGVVYGHLILTNISGNVWVGSGTFMDTQDNRQMFSAGQGSLTGTLNMVRFTTVNGTDTFDAGSVNIMYE